MKLGTETGSLTNHLYSRAVIGQPEPVVGMGATILMWTDRHAATIIDTWKDTKKGTIYVHVREDTAKRTDTNGYGGTQVYEYSPNFNGTKSVFRQEPDGSWMQVVPGSGNRVTWKKSPGPGLRIGEREAYRDPCF